MAPRAMWTGQLRLSLVSFGVRMYAATESARKVSMNQLHKDCNQRVRNQLTCPTHGPITRDEIVKGYEYEKGSYVIIEPSDLEAIRLETTKTIELVQFVDGDEIDALYVNSPYFIGPDGPVAEEPYRVIREAMERSGKVGIGKVVMQGRETIVALGVHGKGFLLTTLKYASEVRSGEQFFEDVKEESIDEEQLTLAESIINGKSKPFDPEAFTDHYQEAFFEVVKQKIAGQTPVVVEDEPAPQNFNFMDALKQSVEEAGIGDKAGSSSSGSKKKTSKKSSSRKPAAKSVPGSGTKKKRQQKRA